MTADDLLADAATRARRYLADIDDRSVAPSDEAVAGLSAFDEAVPDGPTDPASTLALLDDAGSPATVATNAGRYFGFVTGASYPAATASGWLAAAWDQNAAVEVMSPVAATLDRVVGRWIVDLLDLPDGTGTSFVTGATMANATGLAVGRDEVLGRHGWDVPARGLFGAPPLTVVVGAEAHSTIAKSLALIGLGRDRVEVAPADEQGRIDADHLPDVDGPVLVSAQAGNVNTGSFDPFDALADWVAERNGWLHVDGAFGLWARAGVTTRHLTAGLARADSWATDGHKWLNVSYDCGLALVADQAALARTLAMQAAYLPDADVELMNRTPQSSQRARAAEVWAVLRSLGRSGVADLIDRCCAHARHLAEGLADAGHQVLNDVVLNQVLVRFGEPGDEGDATTDVVIGAIQADGTCWCGPTTWHGQRAMRISVSSYATTDADIEASLAAIVRCAASLAPKGPVA
ncbi:MAG: pyridoxal-dependent decarboxylase [Acidimicrobiia bacterium]|nr:pyridoxal-dependent decarboxylase [Acidimicrobiia bacterium]